MRKKNALTLTTPEDVCGMKNTDVRRMWRIACIADHLGIPQSTLYYAATRGSLQSWKTCCGSTMTTMEAVYVWQNSSRKPLT